MAVGSGRQNPTAVGDNSRGPCGSAAEELLERRRVVERVRREARLPAHDEVGQLPPGALHPLGEASAAASYSTKTRSSTSFSATTWPPGSKRECSKRFWNSRSMPSLPLRFFSMVMTTQCLNRSMLPVL